MVNRRSFLQGVSVCCGTFILGGLPRFGRDAELTIDKLKSLAAKHFPAKNYKPEKDEEYVRLIEWMHTKEVYTIGKAEELIKKGLPAALEYDAKQAALVRAGRHMFSSQRGYLARAMNGSYFTFVGLYRVSIDRSIYVC
jgi:hypothetical protein